MKALIMITRTTNREHPDDLTLRECGFKVGDIVPVNGFYHDGSVNVQAIRDTENVRRIDNISVEPDEYVVIEGEV